MSALVAIANAAIAVYTNTAEVRACMPIDDGFLVGTGGGLVWTDKAGAPKRVWTALDGLPATRIDGITMVGTDVWVGTERGGNRVTIANDALVLGLGVASMSVRDVVRFGNETYVATDAGVQVEQHKGMRVPTQRPVAFKGGANKQARARVSSLAIADGALWAGTAGGLYKLRGGTFELVTVETGANDITSLYGDGKTLWIATTNGLYTREGSTVRGYGGGDLRRVTMVDGAIVAAGFGGGFVTIDRGRLIDYKGAPKIPMAQALTERNGVACAGGLDGFAIRASKTAPWTAVKSASSIPANDVSALAADGDTLWVGTFDHGLARFAKGAWTTVTDKKLDHRINALLVEPRAGQSSRLWVATATGISIVDGKNITELTKADGLPARGALSLALLRDGRVLAGTMHGAAIIGDNARPIALGLKQNLEVKNVWAVAEDSEGYLWLGATTGVYRGKPDDSAWTRYSVATKSLRDDWVMALVPNGDQMFVGTYKGGVTRMDITPTTVTAVQLGDGWINPGGLRVEGTTLYAATMEGLRTSDLAATTWATSETFTARDTTATARVGARLFIASRRGIVSPPRR